VSTRVDRITISDEAIGEIIARSGGYEEVERAGRWTKIANSLGLRKDQATAVKARYEDMLKASAEADEREDEDEDEEFEVEDILDSRTDDKGNIEYLVKWKDVAGDDDDDDDNENMTWEPREHLACPELLQQFEEKQRRRQQGETVHSDGDEGANGSTAPRRAATAGAVEFANIKGSAGSKRKHGELKTTDGEVERPPTGCNSGVVSSSDAWQRIVRLQKPESADASLVFEVITSAGKHMLLPNAKLRCEAPLLLVDFYEQRLSFE